MSVGCLATSASAPISWNGGESGGKNLHPKNNLIFQREEVHTMRKILSLVLVLAMVLSSFAFAAVDVNTVGQELKDLGVLKGDNAGNLNPDQNLTREQALVVLARLMGKEAEAAATTVKSSFADVPTDSYYAPYVAYAELQGWTNGKAVGVFGYGEDATMAMMATYHVRALGYEVATLDAGVAKATELKLLTDVTAAAGDTILRGEVFVMMNNTLNTPKMGETQALVYALGLKEVPAPVALEVVSVTATDHKEITVVFNNELDEDTVDEANFEITDGADTSVSLADDNKTVTVVLDDADALADQPLELTLTISGVKDINGLEVAETEYELSIIDSTRPEALSVELTGPQTFEITFSEPIKTAPTVKVDNGIYGSTVSALDGSNVVEVTLSASKLNDGNYDIQVSDFADYAAIAGDTATLTLAYAEDTSIPTASITSATQTEVVVEFDRVVTLDATDDYEDYFSHTFNAWNPDSVVKSGAKYTLTFTTYPIAEGEFQLTINQDGANDVNIEDAWGNEVTEDIILTGSVTADKVAPTILEVEVDDEMTIIVHYSEDVVKSLVEDKDNYTVKDADGDEVDEIKTIAYTNDDDEYLATITFNEKLDGGMYTLEVVDVTDISLAENALVTVALPFEITDLTAITTAETDVEFVLGADTDDEVIYVTYPEKMATSGQYSVLEATNYLLSLDGATFAALDDDAELELFGTTGKVVKITIPDAALVSGTSALRIARVADLAGNEITDFSFDEVMTAVVAPVVTEVLVTDTNKATITVDKPLKVVLASGFTTTSGSIAAIDSWEVNDDNETVIKVTVIAADALDADETASVFASFGVAADILVAETGMKMVAADYTGKLVDGRAPEFDSVVVDSMTQFTVTFTEALVAVSDALAATDFVVTDADGDALVAGVDYTVAVTGTDVVFTLKTAASADDVYEVELADAKYIEDVAENAVADFDAEEVEF
jgi:hypothetical protein